MPREAIPEFIRQLLYARRNRLLEDPAGRSVERTIKYLPDDAFCRSVLTDRVRRHEIGRHLEGEFASPHLDEGELVLGLDQRGRPVRCPLQALNAHSLALAGSGSGKTTRSRFMALQIVPHVQGAWLMDMRKREFAVLRPYLARTGTELIVLPARCMRFNPLQVPKGVEPLDWAAALSDTLVRVL